MAICCCSWPLPHELPPASTRTAEMPVEMAISTSSARSGEKKVLPTEKSAELETSSAASTDGSKLTKICSPPLAFAAPTLPPLDESAEGERRHSHVLAVTARASALLITPLLSGSVTPPAHAGSAASTLASIEKLSVGMAVASLQPRHVPLAAWALTANSYVVSYIRLPCVYSNEPSLP